MCCVSMSDIDMTTYLPWKWICQKKPRKILKDQVSYRSVNIKHNLFFQFNIGHDPISTFNDCIEQSSNSHAQRTLNH